MDRAAETIHIGPLVHAHRGSARATCSCGSPALFDSAEAKTWPSRGVGSAGQREVDQLHVAIVVDEEIVGLDVAMDPTLLLK